MNKYEYYCVLCEIPNISEELELISEAGHEVIGVTSIPTEQMVIICRKPKEVNIKDFFGNDVEED